MKGVEVSDLLLISLDITGILNENLMIDKFVSQI